MMNFVVKMMNLVVEMMYCVFKDDRKEQGQALKKEDPTNAKTVLKQSPSMFLKKIKNNRTSAIDAKHTQYSWV